MRNITKFINIIYQIGILYLLSIIGTWLQQYFNLMVPGSVIGLIILFLLLSMGLLKPYFIKDGANYMIKHLVIFFVPAVVGIVNYLDIFTGSGSWLIIITVISTLIVIIGTGKTIDILEKNEVDEVV